MGRLSALAKLADHFFEISTIFSKAAFVSGITLSRD
jgi:hypothetical protein